MNNHCVIGGQSVYGLIANGFNWVCVNPKCGHTDKHCCETEGKDVEEVRKYYESMRMFNAI